MIGKRLSHAVQELQRLPQGQSIERCASLLPGESVDSLLRRADSTQ